MVFSLLSVHIDELRSNGSICLVDLSKPTGRRALSPIRICSSTPAGSARTPFPWVAAQHTESFRYVSSLRPNSSELTSSASQNIAPMSLSFERTQLR